MAENFKTCYELPESMQLNADFFFFVCAFYGAKQQTKAQLKLCFKMV